MEEKSMNKIVLVVFPTIQRSQYFFEEIVKPISNVKRHDKGEGVTDKYIFKFYSQSFPDKLRGYQPEWIYMSNDLDMETYKVLLQLVKGDHSKIKVVD
jgi:hypothetical protein